MIKNYGVASLNDFLDDHIVYRNLIPYKKEIIGFQEICKNFRINPKQPPRKTDIEYAKVIFEIIKFARKIQNKTCPIKNLIFIGDTIMNDGQAFQNLIKLTNLNGYCFIGSENKKDASIHLMESKYGKIYQSNRWSYLYKFTELLSANFVSIDDSTVLLIDMDKTMVGARGRNDHVIDAVRKEAAMITLNNLFEQTNQDEFFNTIYDTFNLPDYHAFTKDNQDYLVYIAIIIRAGILNFDEIKQIAISEEYSLSTFIKQVDEKEKKLNPKILSMHQNFKLNFKNGDPTPFKEFRQAEFFATTNKFNLNDSYTPKELLSNQIVITEEVYRFATEAKTKGALIFGLSDKPDEASIPTDRQKLGGFLPLHQLSTVRIGAEEEI